MFEKVNKYHPDKVADRIAGAIVDLAYRNNGGLCDNVNNPRIAVEVLLGHGKAVVIIETSLGRNELRGSDVEDVIHRIVRDVEPYITLVGQDDHLAENQRNGLRVGDNGIFCGCPVTDEQKRLSEFAIHMEEVFPSDGKYILDGDNLIVCQSQADLYPLMRFIRDEQHFDLNTCKINPLGYWTGGADVDCGCTNRKLGSDMADAVTGGGLHGKDLSKADVSVNIACYIRAQEAKQKVTACTAIGDEFVTFRYEDGSVEETSFETVVEQAWNFISEKFGSFERFAEHGLI